MSARQWWNHWKGSWKIVRIWKLSSVKDHQWKTQTYKQRESFSTHLFFPELVENPNISFVAHENLHFTPLKDTIHPNMKGSSVIARNLGSHIHNLFWERPRKIARRDLLQPYKLHPQQCRDPLDGKAVGSHGCGDNYWIHMNRLERLSRHQLYLNL